MRAQCAVPNTCIQKFPYLQLVTKNLTVLNFTFYIPLSPYRQPDKGSIVILSISHHIVFYLYDKNGISFEFQCRYSGGEHDWKVNGNGSWEGGMRKIERERGGEKECWCVSIIRIKWQVHTFVISELSEVPMSFYCFLSTSFSNAPFPIVWLWKLLENLIQWNGGFWIQNYF